jgi:Uncharacterized protein conserved in bacteria
LSKITKIEVAKRNKDRVNVYIDEEYAFSCFGELVYKFNLSKDMVVDLEKLNELVAQEEFLKCKSSALRILEKNHKTKKEIEDKLIEKEYSDKAIERTFKFLEEYNFINDDKYSELYIKDKIKNQGRNKIKYTLMRKGIDKEIITEKLMNIDENIERETCLKIAEKKLQSLERKEDNKYIISTKLIKFLISKGYDYEIASGISKEILNISIYD